MNIFAKAEQELGTTAEADSIKSNDVIRQQESLRDAFSGIPGAEQEAGVHSSILGDPHSDNDQLSIAFDACLKPLLAALNWSGEARHLIEASPHIEPIIDLCQFSAVMVTLGFDVKLYHESLSKLQTPQLPCVAIMPNGMPCVVFEIAESGKASIFRGDTQVIEDFHFEKEPYYLCLFSKKVEEDSRLNGKLSWVYESLLKFRQQFMAVVLITCFINILGLATPLYVMTVYDKVFSASAVDTLVYLAIGICLIIGFELYLRSMRGKLVAYIGARFNAALLSGSFGKILSFQISMTESASIGSQLMRIKQFQSISSFFSGKVANAALDLPFIIIFFLVIGGIGGPLAWVPVCLAAVFITIGFITIPITQRNLTLTGKARSKSQNFLLETMEMSTSIRQLGAEHIWQKRFEEYYSELTDLKFRSQFFESVLTSISQGLVMIAGIATLWIGTILVVDGALTVGALIAIMMLVWKILSPIQTMFLSFTSISQMLESVRQVDQLMRLGSERSLGNSSGIYRAYQGDIKFDRVGFRYNQRSEPVANGVSINIDANELVAFTGSNSSGKSTLLKFIIGLYQPQAGAVFVDGLNIKQIDVGELRASIAYVPQDPIFFYGTVAQNIRLFQPTATDDEVYQALSDAGIHILEDASFPEGLDTRLTSRFLEELPEGVRQRLSLARAYAKKSNIYLFDEPFALLDRKGRETFTSKMNHMKGGATIIIATNDLNQLSMCDKIVYLNSGNVVATGEPHEILPMIEAAK